MDLGSCLEMGSHRDGPLWSSRSVVCAPLSTLPPNHVHPGWTACLPSLECCGGHKAHALRFWMPMGHEMPPSKRDMAGESG